MPSLRLIPFFCDDPAYKVFTGMHLVHFYTASDAVNTYRDAVAFHNGVCLRLQELPEGQRVSVLSLAGAQERVPETELEPAWPAI